MAEKITMTKDSNITLSDMMSLFIRKCRVKNLTVNTIKSYEEKCGVFIDYIGKYTPASTITKEMVEDFIVYLQEDKKIKDVSINSYLRSVRALLYYGMECEYVSHYKIQLIKAEKKIKETYTDAQLERLLAKPDVKICKFTEYKIWAFENYLLATGNRISTALNVRIGDINFDEGTIYLRKMKNRCQQLIPLSTSLAGILKEYLSYRGGMPEDYLFCNSYGEGGNIRTFQQEVQRYNIKRNVNLTSVHAFRHTFAKHFILSGGDAFRLQKLLGHSDLTVTKQYVTMFGDDLKTNFDRFCPLDSFQEGRKERKSIKMNRKDGE